MPRTTNGRAATAFNAADRQRPRPLVQAMPRTDNGRARRYNRLPQTADDPDKSTPEGRYVIHAQHRPHLHTRSSPDRDESRRRGYHRRPRRASFALRLVQHRGVLGSLLADRPAAGRDRESRRRDDASRQSDQRRQRNRRRAEGQPQDRLDVRRRGTGHARLALRGLLRRHRPAARIVGTPSDGGRGRTEAGGDRLLRQRENQRDRPEDHVERSQRNRRGNQQPIRRDGERYHL